MRLSVTAGVVVVDRARGDVFGPHLSLPAGYLVTVAPGGQVEISPPPYASAARLLAVASTDAATLSLLLQARGLELGHHGTDPSRPPTWLLHIPRYEATQTAFDLLGPNGLQMMCSTASIQVCLDAGEADQASTRWRAAHALGPALVALFANSPDLGGRHTGWALHADYPVLDIHGVVGDFTEHLGRLPGQAPRLVAFLGGTIGNLFPDERTNFLGKLRDTLGHGEWLLLGTDLVQDPDILIAAYDDAAGVTAEFNRNVLAVINRELGGDFDVENFEHVAIWDPANEWVEMRLRSRAAARVVLSELSLDLVLEAGEEIRTEISAKFRKVGVERELAIAGFTLDSWWTDGEERFALSLARAR